MTHGKKTQTVRYQTKFEDEGITVTRKPWNDTIHFTFDEVLPAYSIRFGKTEPMTDALRGTLRREAVKLAKQQAEHVWG